MTFDEDDIRSGRTDDQRLAGAEKRKAAERLRRQKKIATVLAEAKRLNDARAFAEGLRYGEIREGSAEWKRAWDYFYDRRS